MWSIIAAVLFGTHRGVSAGSGKYLSVKDLITPYIPVRERLPYLGDFKEPRHGQHLAQFEYWCGWVVGCVRR